MMMILGTADDEHLEVMMMKRSNDNEEPLFLTNSTSALLSFDLY